jgi:hypothetical protein
LGGGLAKIVDTIFNAPFFFKKKISGGVPTPYQQPMAMYAGLLPNI